MSAPTSAAQIEIGWVLAGRLDPVDVQAVRQARQALLDRLREAFSGYSWKMPLVLRRELTFPDPAEPVDLIDLGIRERDAYRWDFALVVVAADLATHERPYMFGAPSRAVATAVLSTFRLDPAALENETDERRRVRVLTARVEALALHLFGHLVDAPHRPDPEDVMFDLRTVTDLERMRHLSEPTLERMEASLKPVADPRLEERTALRSVKGIRFFLRALLVNSRDIVESVVDIRPWEFPFRLGRLTTAAVSALLVLLLTAEAWDLGMTQPGLRVAALSLLALAATSGYLLWKQHLLVRHRSEAPGEQRVVSRVSVTLAVLLGMATTYALLFVLTLVVGGLLFSGPLVAAWAASVEGRVGAGHYLALAGFVASLGILIGALGASFEEEGYIRHVTYIDEET